MKFMHIRSADLNLLVVAGALYRHKNVSRAAEELGLSQSAVSHALTRLRDQFNDPLFVRTAKGMAPTEYARKIQADVLEILNRSELLLRQQSVFTPIEAEGRITIASTDYFEVLVMPKLQEVLAREAPLLQLSLRPTRGELPKKDLEDGSIDFAVAGFFKNLPEGFYQSKLFSDEFRCATGEKHRLFKAKQLSRDDYYAARHALITLQGDFRESSKGQERKIVYGTYSFTSMAWVLQNSDLLLTAPALLLKEYQKFFPLRVWENPVPRPGIDIRIIWHLQTHEDPLRSWVREQIKRICKTLSVSS
jgi:DNA-binding transcriptional LysR family regulator